MSKFFFGGSDSEPEKEEDEPIVAKSQPTAANFSVSESLSFKYSNQNLKLIFLQFSDDEKTEKRVVRSQKVKRYEELKNIIKTIRNHKKIKDMSSILSTFENLVKAYSKAIPVISQEEGGVTPKFYLHILAELEDFINVMWEDKDGRKNLSKNNGKSLGTLRQKFRKYLKEFEHDLKKFRETPYESEEEEDEEEEKSVEESDFKFAPKKPVEQKQIKMKEEKIDDDSDSDWGSDSDESMESSDDGATDIRTRFLKKTDDKDDKDDRDDKSKRKKEDKSEYLIFCMSHFASLLRELKSSFWVLFSFFSTLEVFWVLFVAQL